MKEILITTICLACLISCKNTNDKISSTYIEQESQDKKILVSNKDDIKQINSNQIDSIVKIAIGDLEGVVGFAVGVVKDGKVLHAKGYGIKSVNTNEKVTKDTPFAIASNTKAFTTASLAILVDRKKIKWTDKVVKFIPEFKMYNDYVTNNFTIVDLLTHRSGLGLGAGDLMFFPDGSDFTMKDVLTCFQYFEPSSDFRTQYDYDNLLYLVAGEIIARVSKQSWKSFVHKEIINPLKMKNTYSEIGEVINLDKLARPHSFQDSLVPINHTQINSGVNGADGSILSSASDMCIWMLAHLNEGKYGNDLKKQLFSKEQQDEMWHIYTPIKKKSNSRYKNHFSGYGLGWYLSDVMGNLKVNHSGLGPGMVSEVIMIPDIELGIVVMSNSMKSYLLNAVVSRTLIDTFLNVEKYDYLKKAKDIQNRVKKEDSFTKEVWEKVEKNKFKSFAKESYIGIYKDPWFGKIEIYNRKGDLWFKSYRSPKLNGRMYLYDRDTFAIKWEYRDMNADAFATFSIGPQAKNGRKFIIRPVIT
ncbi:serine-type D-Ala-D-Ala carboxypeptidase [Flavobacteriaceae bacterium UJ101]|nr:serine-type D-Ala-D-Ala carboxypeptidase [Flavobacteriaceae bacterium UJ101]